MRALSIRQPWTWCIMSAGKDIENRDWPTRVRGTILLHASAGMTRLEYDDCEDLFRSIKRHGKYPMPDGVEFPTFKDLQRGGIVGQAEITDCIEASISPWFCGHFGFVLKNPKPLPFRPFKGSLGFFNVPDLATV